MTIADARAFPASFLLFGGARVTLGIRQAIERDAVAVKAETAGRPVGGAESHHGRSPGAAAGHPNTPLRQRVVDLEAIDVVGVRARIHAVRPVMAGPGHA